MPDIAVHDTTAALDPSTALDSAWAGRSIHLDHYGATPMPFGCVGAHGVTQQFVELDGDTAGEPFDVLDASGAYAMACLGAGSPVVAGALERGLRTGTYVTDEIASPERAGLLQRLFGPGGLLAETFPADRYHACGRNSGSEGMELALRLVLESRFDRRRLRPTAEHGQRSVILAFEGAWHGWTSGLLPLLNRRHYRVGLPVTAEGPSGITVEHIPFGDIDTAREYFEDHGEQVLAVVIEPVQGDAGILVPPPGYLRAVSGLAAEHGAWVVADEVLTFAKTGRFLAMADESGPVPTDVTVIGKSLGMGAMSLSMVIARRELGVRATGTVATSDLRPLACAVMRDGLEHIVAEGLLDRSAETGLRLGQRLRTELVEGFPQLYHEARGIGVMHGVELTEAAAGHVRRLRETMIRSGVYVEFMSGAGRRSRGLRYVQPTMRIAPPLAATPTQVDTIVDRVVEGSRALRDVVR
jgi:acetylornithine/succinyldiaminopimelate/putrescine aminotransferase